jgi:D-glycero-D-manno-heptose 1,7-bisphosphate phosphatase
VKPPDGQYVEAPDQLRLTPNVGVAIRCLNDAHLPVLVVTNQRAIALGKLTETTLTQIHQRLNMLLMVEAGARIDSFYVCPHELGTCCCRKPEVGLFYQANKQWPHVDFKASVMVGDSLSDVEAGRRLGMATIQIGVDAPDLVAAVAMMVGG